MSLGVRWIEAPEAQKENLCKIEFIEQTPPFRYKTLTFELKNQTVGKLVQADSLPQNHNPRWYEDAQFIFILDEVVRILNNDRQLYNMGNFLVVIVTPDGVRHEFPINGINSTKYPSSIDQSGIRNLLLAVIDYMEVKDGESFEELQNLGILPALQGDESIHEWLVANRINYMNSDDEYLADKLGEYVLFRLGSIINNSLPGHFSNVINMISLDSIIKELTKRFVFQYYNIMGFDNESENYYNFTLYLEKTIFQTDENIGNQILSDTDSANSKKWMLEQLGGNVYIFEVLINIFREVGEFIFQMSNNDWDDEGDNDGAIVIPQEI